MNMTEQRPRHPRKFLGMLHHLAVGGAAAEIPLAGPSSGVFLSGFACGAVGLFLQSCGTLFAATGILTGSIGAALALGVVGNLFVSRASPAQIRHGVPAVRIRLEAYKHDIAPALAQTCKKTGMALCAAFMVAGGVSAGIAGYKLPNRIGCDFTPPPKSAAASPAPRTPESPSRR